MARQVQVRADGADRVHRARRDAAQRIRHAPTRQDTKEAAARSSGSRRTVRDRDEYEFRSDVQMLANRGYALLNVNYRGTTGLGKKFARAPKKQFAGAMRTDLLDGADYLAKQGLIDPKRVAIMGGS
jgi:hypothetical protein